VFVQTPYDQYVNPNTRFWHASGIDVSLSASGLTLETQSVLSILIGWYRVRDGRDRRSPAGG
jgi:paraquat-inducible protein B